MLDISFIRENNQLVAEKAKQKGMPVNLDRLLELDKERRDLLKTVEEMRKTRNEQAKTLTAKPTENQINRGKQLKVELAKRDKYLAETESEFNRLLKTVPNLPWEDVVVGSSAAENVVTKEWGSKPSFDFKPKTHWQIGETSGLIDKRRAAKVAGARFAYLGGDLVRLQFGLINWVLNLLTDQKVLSEIITANGLNTSASPFLPVLPPYVLKTAVFEAMDRLEPKDDRYRVGEPADDLWLQGSAEHVLGPLHMDEILNEADLPRRYLGYAVSFRREAGSYGKETEGIIRLHQFGKLEMESFTTAETGYEEHRLMIAIQEYLMQQLELPYRVLNKCTADIGKPNARGVDIEVWMPGQDRYLETHTADYMTDYQARRLNTKFRRNGDLKLVHTNDATAIAMERTLAAIIENYQTKDNKIVIPSVLKPYFNGQSLI